MFNDVEKIDYKNDWRYGGGQPQRKDVTPAEVAGWAFAAYSYYRTSKEIDEVSERTGIPVWKLWVFTIVWWSTLYSVVWVLAVFIINPVWSAAVECPQLREDIRVQNLDEEFHRQANPQCF
jgi:hypothetical protein